MQEGLVAVPGSTNPAHIQENISIFDFELSESEMEQIRQMDTGKGSHDPEADGIAQMLLGAFDVHKG